MQAGCLPPPAAKPARASAMTAGFGAIAEPLANARGSVRSHNREKP
jgi:hypothetical protein